MATDFMMMDTNQLRGYANAAYNAALSRCPSVAAQYVKARSLLAGTPNASTEGRAVSIMQQADYDCDRNAVTVKSAGPVTPTAAGQSVLVWVLAAAAAWVLLRK